MRFYSKFFVFDIFICFSQKGICRVHPCTHKRSFLAYKLNVDVFISMVMLSAKKVRFKQAIFSNNPLSKIHMLQRLLF